MMFVKRAPCPGGGQWSWVVSTQLPFGRTSRQRIYAFLRTRFWHTELLKASSPTWSEHDRKRDRTASANIFLWQLSSHLKSVVVHMQILTSTVVAVSRREFDSHYFLQVMRHAHSFERWSEVNLIGLSFRTIGVISHLVTPSDVLHHPWSKQEITQYSNMHCWVELQLETNLAI